MKGAKATPKKMPSKQPQRTVSMPPRKVGIPSTDKPDSMRRYK